MVAEFFALLGRRQHLLLTSEYHNLANSEHFISLYALTATEKQETNKKLEAYDFNINNKQINERRKLLVLKQCSWYAIGERGQ